MSKEILTSWSPSIQHLLEALGLKGRNITRLTIDITVDDVVRVQLEELPSLEKDTKLLEGEYCLQRIERRKQDRRKIYWEGIRMDLRKQDRRKT